MITLDGSFGEGGGQIVRSALALSILTQQPLTIYNIRANRKKPGLRQQHLTALRAAAQICNARLSGDKIGSNEIRFHPTPVFPGAYHFRVGTAGSTSLVLQTILPPLLMADDPSTITIEGGTHNPMAPPFHFLDQSFLPFLRKMGFKVHVSLKSYGFFPAGGGKIVASVKPRSTHTRLVLHERGPHKRTTAVALSSNLAEDITHREISLLTDLLKKSHVFFEEQNIRTAGPGNLVWISDEYENVTETITSFGERGKPARKVVQKLVDEYNSYASSDAPVGPHLADQLLIPMALSGGGEFVATELTKHTATNIKVIKKFLDIKVVTEWVGDQAVLVRLSPAVV